MSHLAHYRIGYRVGRVKLVFKLPKSACQQLLPDVVTRGHLAYVEWFTAFTHPDPVHGLYKVTRCQDRSGARLADVVEVRHIRRSCHLYPVTSDVIPREWTSSTVLDRCNSFFVSPFSDAHMYMTLF